MSDDNTVTGKDLNLPPVTDALSIYSGTYRLAVKQKAGQVITGIPYYDNGMLRGTVVLQRYEPEWFEDDGTYHAATWVDVPFAHLDVNGVQL